MIITAAKYLGILAVILLLGFLFYGGCRQAQFAGVCDEAGYPRSKTTWPPFKGFCFKRVNGTDIMVPVDKLPKE